MPEIDNGVQLVMMFPWRVEVLLVKASHKVFFNVLAAGPIDAMSIAMDLARKAYKEQELVFFGAECKDNERFLLWTECSTLENCRYLGISPDTFQAL